MYTNAQSIVNKIDELRSFAVDLKPDIILINESWTNKDIECVSQYTRVRTISKKGQY